MTDLTMKQRLEDFALRLFDIGAVKFRKQSPDGKGFRLKLHDRNPDAPLSPIYFNLRDQSNPKPGPLSVNELREAGELMLIAMQENQLGFDCVAGLPNAGTPLAFEFRRASQSAGRQVSEVTLIKGEAGGKRRIVDVLEKLPEGQQQEVLIVDDLITEADTKLEGAAVLRENRYTVCCVLVLIDREQGGATQLEKADLTLYSLFSMTELLRLYCAKGRITDAQKDDVLSYMAGSK